MTLVDLMGRQGYELRLSSTATDPQWDGFLSVTAGGHHLQSSHWGRVKAALGWRAVRVLAVSEGRIRGGAQVLLRRLPVVGSIGYVPLGPVLESGDPTLRDAVLNGLHEVGRSNRVLLLVVQPPAAQEAVVADLVARGFRGAGALVEPHPTATVLVDLGQDEPALLAAMKKATRYNVRLAERKGVSVREGGHEDVPTFYRLLTMTSRRQGFPVPSIDYFRRMLEVMAPDGHARIFVAEFEGEPLSAALAIAFGDRVSYKRGAWSARHRHVHPNELLQWTVMRWAKRAGYRYYDMEGIDPGAARAVPDGVSAFKLGFGGEVVFLPGPYERIRNPALRVAYHVLGRHLLDSPPARRLVDTIRTR
jgi:peptidoglycan pentaglycine glycine transferase (the first glycine)